MNDLPFDLARTDTQQLMLYRERLRDLAHQLRVAGPQHFHQASWFVGDPDGDGEDPNLDHATPTSEIASFDVHNCGASACLAGHGAIVMTRSRTPIGSTMDKYDVSEYFGLPLDWFAGDLGPGHPHFEMYDQLLRSTVPTSIAQFTCQLVGISDVIRSIHHEIARRRATTTTP